MPRQFVTAIRHRNSSLQFTSEIAAEIRKQKGATEAAPLLCTLLLWLGLETSSDTTQAL
jgi:hypothetical protein